MEPKVEGIAENNNILEFTLNNCKVCYANAIRRVIISNIPCVVFETFPYNKNKVDITENTTRYNNEIIKQRLSCIPIHIDIFDKDIEIDDYIVELHVTNDTKTIKYVTTNDFKIKSEKTQKYIKQTSLSEIFPLDKITNQPIDIIRLLPKLNNVSQETIKLTSKLSILTAEDNGSFNVASTCTYSNTPDNMKIKEEWESRKRELLKTNTQESIKNIEKNFYLLDAKRYFIENSYIFKIESESIYNNFRLVDIACSIIINRLYKLLDGLKTNPDLIYQSSDTMDNCYICRLENEDYTIGKIVENSLYSMYFNQKKILSYCGFLKQHPHDNYSIIKIAFVNSITYDDIIVILEECITNDIAVINKIKNYFRLD